MFSHELRFVKIILVLVHVGLLLLRADRCFSSFRKTCKLDIFYLNYMITMDTFCVHKTHCHKLK